MTWTRSTISCGSPHASGPHTRRVLRRSARARRRVKVVVLSGGVGGARFLRGLVAVVDPGNVSIVGNVADDLEVLGLHVSPDLDSILYTLTGLSDEERGWGRADESWRALETVAELGGETWFRLGDRDLGLHLVRTELLRDGVPLSEATARIAHALGLEPALLPATDDPVRTFLETPAGTFPFQTWFVARGHRDEVDAVHYAGAPEARAAPGVLEALAAADLILIAPEQPVRLDRRRSWRSRRSARRSSSAPCRASPSARSSAAGPSRARPTGCCCGSPAERRRRTSPAATTGLIDALVVDEADEADDRCPRRLAQSSRRR